MKILFFKYLVLCLLPSFIIGGEVGALHLLKAGYLENPVSTIGTDLSVGYANYFFPRSNSPVSVPYDTARTIVVPKESVGVNFEELIAKVRYLPLEFTPESSVKSVTKLLVGKTVIVIWDRQSDAVLLFDKKGKFISKLGSLGKGQGEYLQIFDIAIDEIQKCVIIGDMEKRSMLYFDFKGYFLRNSTVKDLMKSGIAFTTYNQALIFNRGYYNFDGHYLGVFDQDSLTLKTALIPYRFTSLRGADFLDNFCPFNDKLFYLAPFTNTIYEVDKDFDTRLVYNITFENMGSNPDFRDIDAQKFNNIKEFYEYCQKKGYLLNMNRLKVTDNYVHFSFGDNTYSNTFSIMQSVFFRKANGKTKLISGVKPSANDFWSTIVAVDGNEFVSVISSPNDTAKSKGLIVTDVSKGNPCLAFYTLNDSLFQ